MIFRDRDEAARLLGEELRKVLKSSSSHKPLVLGIPRGAVPMAKVVADDLGADLDLLLVHKLPHPHQPELAIGAVTEAGAIFLGDVRLRQALSEQEIAEVAREEINKLHAKRLLYTAHRRSFDLRGRCVILVDDGVATGSTMLAGVRSVQESGAGEVIVAAPVISQTAEQLLKRAGATVVSSHVPEVFYAVSQFYERFDQVEDAEVVQVLAGRVLEVPIVSHEFRTTGFLTVPPRAEGLVIFAHGSGSGRHSPRNQFVARELNKRGLATLLADLLTPQESQTHANVFKIDLLAHRLERILEWVKEDYQLSKLAIGLFGASTGAAAALLAAYEREVDVKAVVSRGGRVDLANSILRQTSVPCLFIVGDRDEPVLTWNQQSFALISAPKKFHTVHGAGHLFEEPGALEDVANVSGEWFVSRLTTRRPGVPRELRI